MNYFEKAVKWQLLGYNVADKVDKPPLQKNKINIYTREELRFLLVCIDKDTLKHQVMAYLSLSTGMRRGELFGLQWRHIDFTKNTIKIEQPCQYIPSKGVFIKSTKTEESNRTISVPPSVMALLGRYKKEQKAKKEFLANK